MATQTLTTALLEEVEIQLRRALETDPLLDEVDGGDLLAAARQLCLADGAKRVRPRLVLLFGHAVEAPPAGMVDVGVASELIHAGSLLHDDVVDQGTTRRGRPTVNAHWGNMVAVLSGDLVLTLAFLQIRGWPREITAEAVETIAEMSRAAMAEVQVRGRLDLPLERWRRIVEGKTGALFSWCGRGAARLAGDDDALERFTRCGRHLGVAFQLGDDLLDLASGAMGKDRFSDIKNREPTYPILAVTERSPGLKRDLGRLWRREVLTPEEVARAGAAIVDAGAVDLAAGYLADEIAQAVASLGPYGERPGGKDLAELALEMGQRVFAGEL